MATSTRIEPYRLADDVSGAKFDFGTRLPSAAMSHSPTAMLPGPLFVSPSPAAFYPPSAVRPPMPPGATQSAFERIKKGEGCYSQTAKTVWVSDAECAHAEDSSNVPQSQ